MLGGRHRRRMTPRGGRRRGFRGKPGIITGCRASRRSRGSSSPWPLPLRSPPMSLFALFETDRGPIKIELYPDKAPLTVANFVNLARRGFYDGLNFHRVIPD